MQVGPVSAPPIHTLLTQLSRPEARESGPDRDNDGDEGVQAAKAARLPSPPPGRGGVVDVSA